ncbi:MAG: hypothetical protein HY526_05635, partial [Betaproteobacteria bacterium]|nr:hypothetical protein [Betaproteobacteria bacterium]
MHTRRLISLNEWSALSRSDLRCSWSGSMWSQSDFSSSQCLRMYSSPPWMTFQSALRASTTPRGHPLLRLRQVGLRHICRYPLITYDGKLAGGWRVMQAFEEKGLKPNVVLTATDADVIKAYVAA